MKVSQKNIFLWEKEKNKTANTAASIKPQPSTPVSLRNHKSWNGERESMTPVFLPLTTTSGNAREEGKQTCGPEPLAAGRACPREAPGPCPQEPLRAKEGLSSRRAVLNSGFIGEHPASVFVVVDIQKVPVPRATCGICWPGVRSGPK